MNLKTRIVSARFHDVVFQPQGAVISTTSMRRGFFQWGQDQGGRYETHDFEKQLRSELVTLRFLLKHQVMVCGISRAVMVLDD
ncbi:MAG: hypothetical protein HGB36_13380 [Chlorobiaceae bacterium]|jgi:hypothetical protein|nr:hypothetical protein [Chlorobiaceae bacterium]